MLENVFHCISMLYVHIRDCHAKTSLCSAYNFCVVFVFVCSMCACASMHVYTCVYMCICVCM